MIRSEVLREAYEQHDHAPLKEAFRTDIPDEKLAHALTHRSFANEHDQLPNNERLEFVGDAILGLTIAGRLYELYPTSDESILSKMRASIVSRYGLSDVARRIGLGPYILLGKGERNSGGADRDSILADTMEAILGAIYLEFGFAQARDVILALFRNELHNASARGKRQDWKTTLAERLAELKLPVAEYQTTSTGPDHARTFRAQALVNGVVRGAGIGPNKRTAEQQAAEAAVQSFLPGG